nr:MAG TPA_asm: hypothetical protein [Caudoviricetes sp.]
MRKMSLKKLWIRSKRWDMTSTSMIEVLSHVF